MNASKRSIPDYPHLYAQSDGTILGPTSEGLRPRRVRRHKGGLFIRIKKGGRIHERSVARLVLEAFVGPRSTEWRASHRDGDAFNNRLANLAWKTYGDDRPRPKPASRTRARSRVKLHAKATRSSRRKKKTQ